MSQGSILGTVLILLYINDTFNITTDAQFIPYADDMSLFFSGTDADSIVETKNRVFDLLESWAKLNAVTIIISQTK